MTALRRVTFVQGGLARVGGIESFAADLLSSLTARHVHAELICWGAGGSKGNPVLADLSMSNVKIWRTSWRWGCRWGWPDLAMMEWQWKRFVDAELLVFGKLLQESVQQRLSSLGKRMILITPYRPAEMWKDRRPDKKILNSFESIIVQAQVFEEDLRRLGYEGQIVTLPYLPPQVQKAGAWPATSVLQVGFLGRLVPDKNVEYLIRSFSSLPQMGIEAQLHLFGDGPERVSLQTLVGEMKLVERIRFHGSRDRKEIPAAIDRCHLFAFSSRTEGQCLAALEILARGRPVLGTPVGAFPEFLCGPLGCVAPLDSPIAFATALKALAEPILKGEIAPTDVQRAYRNRFSRSQVIDAYMQVFGCLGATRMRKQAV